MRFMIMMTRLLLAAVPFFSLYPISAHAEDSGQGSITGQINFCGTGAGVAGLRVYVPGRQFFIIIGDDGKFTFDQLPTGQMQLNYMLNNKVIDHKTNIVVFKGRTSDVGEITLCDDPDKAAPVKLDEDGDEIVIPKKELVEQEAPSELKDSGCTEGHLIKLPNGVGECKNNTILLMQCDKKFSDCDGKVENGCETDIWSDNDNCGACDNECAGSEICAGGDC